MNKWWFCPECGQGNDPNKWHKLDMYFDCDKCPDGHSGFECPECGKVSEEIFAGWLGEDEPVRDSA